MSDEPHPLLDDGETRARIRDEWKRRQAIEVPQGTLLAPTLPMRIARLNPFEQAELRRIVKSLKLRKIIRRTLAEAYWQGEDRRAAQARFTGGRTLDDYERAMGPSADAVSFVPVVTENTKTVIEVPR